MWRCRCVGGYLGHVGGTHDDEGVGVVALVDGTLQDVVLERQDHHGKQVHPLEQRR